MGWWASKVKSVSIVESLILGPCLFVTNRELFPIQPIPTLVAAVKWGKSPRSCIKSVLFEAGIEIALCLFDACRWLASARLITVFLGVSLVFGIKTLAAFFWRKTRFRRRPRRWAAR